MRLMYAGRRVSGRLLPVRWRRASHYYDPQPQYVKFPGGSPDGHWFLYSSADDPIYEIMQVENFR